MPPLRHHAVRITAFGLLGAIFALFQGAFLTVFVHPVRALDVPLVLIIGLVATYRFSEAFAASIGAGFIREALATGTFGSQLVITVALTAALIALFSRVFTDISFVSVSVLCLSGFVIGWLMRVGASRVIALMSGESAAPLMSPGAFFGVLVLQLLCSLASLAALLRRGRTARYAFV